MDFLPNHTCVSIIIKANANVTRDVSDCQTLRLRVRAVVCIITAEVIRYPRSLCIGSPLSFETEPCSSDSVQKGNVANQISSSWELCSENSSIGK